MTRTIHFFSVSTITALVSPLFMVSALAQKAPDAPKPVAKPAATAKAAAKSACKLDEKGTTPVKVKLSTSMGAITLELDKEKAPVSTENFVKYVESGHYNGTIFHRVIGNFMIQGGGFDKNMNQKPTNPPIKNEATNGLRNDNYTVAMARTNVVDSATSQFFINVKNNDFLNHAGPANFGYAVFGKVVEGMDVVEKIKAVPTTNKGGHGDVPVDTVTIEKAECI